MAAIHVLPPFDRLAVNDNSVERLAEPGQDASVVEWRAIHIVPTVGRGVRYLAAAGYIASAEAAYVLTATRAAALPVRPADLSIRGNLLRGQLTAAPLNQCAAVDHCLFADNRCEMRTEGGKEPALGDLAARTLNASNNRLLALGDLVTLALRPGDKRAIVMGNASSGPKENGA